LAAPADLLSSSSANASCSPARGIKPFPALGLTPARHASVNTLNQFFIMLVQYVLIQ
jgi:hypothetical protein